MKFKIEMMNKYYEPFYVYNIFKNREDSIFLDSSKEDESLSRFSFIALNPIKKLVKRKDELLVDGKKKNPCDFF